jgi:hypothetical protein
VDSNAKTVRFTTDDADLRPWAVCRVHHVTWRMLTDMTMANQTWRMRAERPKVCCVLRRKLDRFLGRRDVQRLRPRLHGSVPADLRDVGRDVPSRPATVLWERRSSSSSYRRGAMPGSGRSLQKWIRSRSDVDAAAVDLDADSPPAGRRCCRVVEQGAAVGLLNGGAI